MRLPFPIYPELSVMEAFEKLDDPIWTTITPKTNVTVDSTDLQDITVRGLTKCRLLPKYVKKSILRNFLRQKLIEFFV